MSLHIFSDQSTALKSKPRAVIQRVHSLCGGEQTNALSQTIYNGRKLEKLTGEINELNLKISAINKKIDNLNGEIKEAFDSRLHCPHRNFPLRKDDSLSPNVKQKGASSDCSLLSEDLGELSVRLSNRSDFSRDKIDISSTFIPIKPLDLRSGLERKNSKPVDVSESGKSIPLAKMTRDTSLLSVEPVLKKPNSQLIQASPTPREWMQRMEESRKVCFDAAMRIAKKYENPSLYLDIILQSIHEAFFLDYTSRNTITLQENHSDNLLVVYQELHELFELLGPEWAPKLIAGAIKLEMDTLHNMLMPLRANTLSIKLFRQFTIFCLPGLGNRTGKLSKAFEELLVPIQKKASDNPQKNVVLLWEGLWRSEDDQIMIRQHQKTLQEITIATTEKIFSKIKGYFRKGTPDQYRDCCRQIVAIFKANYLKHGYNDEALNEEQSTEKALLLLASVLFFRIISPNLSHLPKNTVGDLGLYFGKIVTSIGNQSKKNESEFLGFIPKLCTDMKNDLLKLIGFLAEK